MTMEIQPFDSVFDAIADTPSEAVNMKARSALLSALTARVQSWGLSQEAAAVRLMIIRPRLNDPPPRQDRRVLARCAGLPD